jgi:folate-binding protein YgfZ|tara:strand:+ start:602 stop:1492 length:891 start_codon:yes stop_codon:yes gene_type:complete
MNNKNVYILDDRAIFYLNGNDAKIFLQNLISNDINKVSDNSSCFTSLLSPQGKFLYEFIIIKHKSGYLIDCEKSQADGLFRQLSIYKLRSKIEILNLSNEFVVAAFAHEKFLTFEQAQDFAGFTLKYREDPIFLDPRNKHLGARLVINLEKLYLSLKKLDLQGSELKDYYLFSHKLGIVPKDLNKLQNKLFGIECNYDELNGIDFKKGCYVGQENTARIKLKNKLSKRLFPVNLVKGKLTDGESVFYNENEIGKILIDGDYPFALVKYLDVNFNGKSDFSTKDASINIEKPQWIKT